MKLLLENWRKYLNEVEDPDSDADDAAELKNMSEEDIRDAYIKDVYDKARKTSGIQTINLQKIEGKSNYVELNNLVVHKEARGSGVATEMMNYLTQKADLLGLGMELQVLPVEYDHRAYEFLFWDEYDSLNPERMDSKQKVAKFFAKYDNLFKQMQKRLSKYYEKFGFVPTGKQTELGAGGTLMIREPRA